MKLGELLLPAFCLVLLCGSRPILAESEIATSVSTGWESKYVTEGRENIEGGLYSVDANASYEDFTLGIWYGVDDNSENEAYDEVDLYIEKVFFIGDLETYVGYTRIAYPEYNESDNEFSTGFSYAINDWFTPGVDYRYSTEADGDFVEIYGRGHFTFLNEKLTVEPAIIQGLDYGYATPEHDGENNVHVQTDITFALTEVISITGYVAHSWAQEDVDRDETGDLTWGSVGIMIAMN